MKKIYFIFLSLILIINSKLDGPISVTINVTSEIINKEIISEQKILSFNIT